MNDNPYQTPETDAEPEKRDPGSCPSCGGHSFCEGVVKTRGMLSVFVPDNWSFFRFRSGLDTKSLACVDCGNVRDFIARKDLDALS